MPGEVDQRLMISVAGNNEDLKRAFDEAKAMTKNYTDFAMNADKDIEDFRENNRKKSADEIRKNHKEAEKALKQRYEKAKQAAKGNTEELKLIERKYLQSREKMAIESEKDILKARERFVKQGQDKINKAGLLGRRKIKKKILAELKGRYEKEISQAKGNAAEIKKIEKALAKDINRIRGKIKPPPDERKDKKGMAGKMKAGWAAAGAAVGGLVAGVAKLISSTAEASEQFEAMGLKVETLLNATQAEKLPQAMDQLRSIALETGDSLENLSDALFNTISAAPQLADNLDAATSIVEKASKAAVGLQSDTNSVVNAMTNLGNAAQLNLEDLDNQNLLLDTMAMTFKQGKISGEQLSATFAKSAPILRSVTETGEDTVAMLGASVAMLTASGVSADEAQTQIKAFAAELMDAGKRTKLLEAGLEGINEAGKIEDPVALMKSLGQNTEEFVGIIGSIEAKNAVLTLTKESGEAFGKLIGDMKDASGTASGMYETMADSAEIAKAKQDAAMQDFAINVGQHTKKITANWRNMIGGMLTTVSEWFKTDKQKFDELSISFKKSAEFALEIKDIIGGQITEIQKITDATDVTQDQITQQINNIGEAALKYKDEFPFIVKHIQDIISATPEGKGTIGTLETLNVELDKMQKIAKSKAFMEGTKAIEAGWDALEENIEDAVWRIEGFSNTWKMMFEDADDKISFLNEELYEMGDELEVIRKTIEETDDSTIEGREKIADLRAEETELADEIRGVEDARMAVQNEYERKFGEILEHEKLRNEIYDSNLTKEQLIENVRREMVKQSKAEGETLAFINEMSESALKLEIEKSGNIEKIVELREKELQGQINIAEFMLKSEMISGNLTDEEKARIKVQLASLKIAKESAKADVEKEFQTKKQLENEEAQKKEAEERKKLLDDEIKANQKIGAIKVDNSEVTKAVNLLVAQRLGDEKATVEEKLKLLKELKLENEQQLSILNKSIRKLETKLLEITAQEELNKLTGVELENRKKTAAGIKDQITELKNEAAILTKAGEEMGKQIGKIEAGETQRKAMGRLGLKDKAITQREKKQEDKLAKEKEKAEKERLKKEKEHQKRLEEQRKKELEVVKFHLKEREIAHKKELELENRRREERKAQIEAIKQAKEERAKAEKEMREKIKEMQEQNKQLIAGAIGESSKNISAMVRAILPKTEMEEYKDTIKDIEERSEALAKESEKVTKELEKTKDASAKLSQAKKQELIDAEIIHLRAAKQKRVAEGNIDRLERLKRSYDLQFKQSQQTAAHQEAYSKAIAGVNEDLEDQKNKLSEANKEYSDTKSTLDDLKKGIREASNSFASASKQQKQAIIEQAKARKVAKTLELQEGLTVDISSVVGRLQELQRIIQSGFEKATVEESKALIGMVSDAVNEFDEGFADRVTFFKGRLAFIQAQILHETNEETKEDLQENADMIEKLLIFMGNLADGNKKAISDSNKEMRFGLIETEKLAGDALSFIAQKSKEANDEIISSNFARTSIEMDNYKQVMEARLPLLEKERNEIVETGIKTLEDYNTWVALNQEINNLREGLHRLPSLRKKLESEVAIEDMKEYFSELEKGIEQEEKLGKITKPEALQQKLDAIERNYHIQRKK
jgi:hypothetical protein